MKKHMIAALAIATTLGLAGCSTGGNDVAAPEQGEVESTPTETVQTPVENIDKTWTFEYQGATGKFDLRGDSSDENVQGVEAARQLVDGQAVYLVPVTIDNTNGSSAINMYKVTVITKDGQQVESMDLSDAFSAWRDAAGDDTDRYNALIDAGNKYALFDLQPGAKGTAVVAFQQPVTSAWRVTVAPAGGSEQVEAAAKP
ncbi:hypothetical protein QP735_04435 [Curtobacterium citreum]|uniref:hypothetical protein n=1 Tax=Curtobacterium citreum TaxID=2036 RepID=UPI00254C0CB9|nr:hypothetical protein [Curtobacterium citreum]MDK8171771.1 hypothetical protein [Curtobacterium citreum]